jgi:hypothetical protein
MAKTRGAPKKAPEERRSELVPIRFTKAEKESIDTAAGGNTSAWARDILLKAAKHRRRLTP